MPVSLPADDVRGSSLALVPVCSIRKRTLCLAALGGLCSVLALLFGMSRIGQATVGQNSEVGANAQVPSSLPGQVVSTSSYTGYLPLVFSDYASPEWTLLGLDGIPVRQIEVSGGDPETVYAVVDATRVSTTTFLYKSSDSGLTWQPASAGISGRVQSLFVHPATPSMLLAGTLMGDGVYYSYDSAVHWSPTSVYPFIRAVAAHPTTPTLWLAASYNPLIFGAAYIHLSDDAGANWRMVTETAIVNTLLFDPNHLNCVYACAVDGFLRSDDAGLTWTYVTSDGCDDLVINPATTTVMYAAGADAVLKTENNGVNWTSVLTVGQSIRAVAIAPTTPEVVYAATSDVVFRSTDAGCSWQRVNLPSTSTALHVEDLAVGHSGMLYMAADRGIWAILLDPAHRTGTQQERICD